MKIFSLKIGGQAGQGIKSAGLMLAKVATRSGYNIYTYTEYPSLIRGGHNIMQICLGSEEVLAPQKYTNFLICLNQDTLDRHLSELSSGSSILFDGSDGLDTSKVPKKINLFPVPLSEISTTVGGSKIMINTVALGATIAILGGNLEILNNLINESFPKEIAQQNLKAAAAGFDFVTRTFPDKIISTLKTMPVSSPQMIVNGNEAIALGSIAAGLQFAAIYPMTPTSNILTVLAENQEKYGFIYKQPEDEIAAINMAIGASFAGARSMCATSGGGFCLMAEGYGLAANIETPLVIIEGMRPGPATGLPTWSEQGDLKFVLHAHQGDFPRIVLAAGDAKEAFELTMDAFNIADEYQTPVILLVDKNICEGDQSFPLFDYSSYKYSHGKFTADQVSNYQRYLLSDDGISQRTIPGVGNFFIANSDEHDQSGYSTESSSVRIDSMKKRMQKLETYSKKLPTQHFFGNSDADLTIISWGSNKGSILQAMENFSGRVNYLHLTHISPFPKTEVAEILGRAKNILSIECNFTGQLAEIIREKTGIETPNKLLKYDGRPIYPEEIIEKINTILQ